MEVGSIGDIIFEVSEKCIMAPQMLTLENGARFATHEVQGALPRLEFLAPELEGITMPIRLRRDMGVDPVWEADQLREKCRAGKVLRLIIAGENMGNYVLEKVSQTWRMLSPDGSGVLFVDVNLTLKEYV